MKATEIGSEQATARSNIRKSVSAALVGKDCTIKIQSACNHKYVSNIKKGGGIAAKPKNVKTK